MRLALDIGGTFVKCAIVSDDGGIVRSGNFPTDPNHDTAEFANALVDGAEDFLHEGNEQIKMVGAGMAGFTDGNRGIVYESPNIPNIKYLELARVLTDGFGVPSYAENDATAAAWGEYLFGGHSDVRNMMIVTLGTGIGGGLVLDGRLFRGEKGMAGEFGQMILDPEGPVCRGGGKGCLEHWVGRVGFEEDYRHRAGLTEKVEPKIIHERAVNGEQAAIDAWNEYGSRLGIQLASAANLLDLGSIVLTGGLVGAWSIFEGAMMEAFRTYLITPHKDTVRITRSELGGKAGILGAAFLDKAH